MMPAHFVIIGEADSPRVQGFAAACDKSGGATCDIVSYLELFDRIDNLRNKLQKHSIIRIESPGKNFLVEKELLCLGFESAQDEPYAKLSMSEIRALSFNRGRILPSRQWYLGFNSLLIQLKEIARDQQNRFINQPDDIALMFDKIGCQSLFASESIPVAKQLGPISSFEDLLAKMKSQNCSRVFLKLAHGSSASGILAFRMNDSRMQASSTVELAEVYGETQLFNSRKLQVMTSRTEIERLVNELCKNRAFAEEWIVKANYKSSSCDLRIVTISGAMQHSVLRMSKGPFTNLHLLNQRADTSEFIKKMGHEQWQSIANICTRTASLFSQSLYMGIDLLVASNFKRIAVAEVNAFGDQLKGVLHNGVDTYTAELTELLIPSDDVSIKYSKWDEQGEEEKEEQQRIKEENEGRKVEDNEGRKGEDKVERKEEARVKRKEEDRVERKEEEAEEDSVERTGEDRVERKEEHRVERTEDKELARLEAGAI